MSDGMDDAREVRLLDVFKEFGAEADAISHELNSLFENRNITACIMAMGAVIGSQLGDDKEDRMTDDRLTILMGSINLQVAAQKVMSSKKHMN